MVGHASSESGPFVLLAQNGAQPSSNETIKAYEYRDAATLLGDFWTTVDAVLRERGVIP